MVRKIITIDKDKCIGCGLCVNACDEGAIGMVDGKAQLLRDDYCDGLGNCLPVCPTDAISFVERKALPFDAEAVKENMDKKKAETQGNLPCGCPGTAVTTIDKPETAAPAAPIAQGNRESQLRQWPVQIKLVPVNAPYFDNAKLLIAADCTAFAHGNFHEEFIKDRVTLIGCPKLDAVDYTEKLTEIIKNNNIKSITVTRMEVPCCKGIEVAVMNAIKASGKMIPWRIVTVRRDGSTFED